MEKIRIQYLDDTIERLCYIDGKSDWIDLRAAEDVELKAGEFRLIHLGVAMQLPAGYEAHIVPRSSTFKNFGILQTNHMGVIDETYCGPEDWWRMPVYAVRDTVIHKNDRICQFRLMEHQPGIVFEEGKLQGENRGGFGSTGRAVNLRTEKTALLPAFLSEMGESCAGQSLTLPEGIVCSETAGCLRPLLFRPDRRPASSH